MDERTAESTSELTARRKPLSAREAAAALGVSERTIRRAIDRGDLTALKRGGTLQVAPNDLARYRAQRYGKDRASPHLLRLVPPSRREAVAERRAPAPLASFIGRERELASLRKLLQQPDVRLLTLTGPGGVGKTRLALAVVDKLEKQFADGVVVVSLAPVNDPDLVGAAIAQALGLREPSDRLPDEALRDFLQRRELLLILDNFEHLLPAVAFVADLLLDCQRLKILVTSRTVLGIYGERDLPVLPFDLPDLANLPTTEELGHLDVICLFSERAQAASSSFTLTADNAAAVAAICHRLDGLPLAVELAAARSKLLPPQALLDRLERRLSILTGTMVGQPERFRSLRDAIDWSYALLSREEQTFFRCLAVFVGGFTLEAAEWVAGSQDLRVSGAEPESPSETGTFRHETRSQPSRHPVTLTPSFIPSVLDLVTSLVDKSLLRRIEADDAEPRLGMLETIHEFAREQLAASGEEARARWLHADFFISLAERNEPEFYGPRQGDAFARLTREQANVRAALAWTLENNEALMSLRLAVALGRFWHVGGFLRERQRWLEQILARVDDAPASLRARALCLLGDGAYDAGDLAAARSFYQQSFTIASEANERQQVAEALLGLGGIAADQEGNLASAEAHFARSLALREDTGDHWGAALMHLNLADIAAERGDKSAAHSLIETGLATWRTLGYRQGIGRALFMLAQLDEEQGDLPTARVRYEESLAAWRSIGYRAGVAEAAASVAWLILGAGDHGAATSLFGESLAVWREIESRRGIASTLMGCAALATARGQFERSLRLAGTAAALHVAMETSPTAQEESRLEPWLSSARRALSAGVAKAAWTDGMARPVAAAVEEATAVCTGAIEATPVGTAPSTAAAFGLTPRELEVLRLVAHHATDREVADALSISPRTVMHHVSHILAKLGVTSRRDAAAWADRQGIA